MSIRPLRDWLVVKRLEYKSAVGLEVVGIELSKGTVVAAGPGRPMRRKVKYLKNPERPSEGHFACEDGEYTGKVRPMRVKVGDVVEFSSRDRRRGGTEFTINGETFLLIPEQSVFAIDPNGSQSRVIWSQQSAGFERDGSYLSR